jgi:hypothetical protein
MRTVWIYVNTGAEVGDVGTLPTSTAMVRNLRTSDFLGSTKNYEYVQFPRLLP